MKIYNYIAIISFFMFLPACLHADSDMDEKKPLTTPYINETNSKIAVEEEIKAKTQDLKQDQETVKAEKVCLGQDCRSNWPSLKCASFEGRPAGETGDQFCSQSNKTCVAVFIGSGQSFFDECSVPTNSIHKCRCCWIE